MSTLLDFSVGNNCFERSEIAATLINTPEGQGRLPYIDEKLMKRRSPNAYVPAERTMPVSRDWIVRKFSKVKNELVTFTLTAVPEKGISTQKLKLIIESFGIDWFLPANPGRIKARARAKDFTPLENLRMAALFVRDRIYFGRNDESIPNWVVAPSNGERKATLAVEGCFFKDVYSLMNDMKTCGLSDVEFSSSDGTAKNVDEFIRKFSTEIDSSYSPGAYRTHRGDKLIVSGEKAVDFIEKIRVEDLREEFLKRMKVYKDYSKTLG